MKEGDSFKYLMVSTDIMTTQVNLRLPEDFLLDVKRYAKKHGFLNVQEFFREAVREKIYTVRPSYLKVLKSKEANTFLTPEETKAFEAEMRRRVNEGP